MSEVACKTKSMSTPDNLIEAAQTTLLQAKGLDKLDRLTTPTLVKATTLDIGRHLFVLGVLTDSSPSYLLRLLPSTSNNLPQHGTISFDTGQPFSLASWFKASGLMYCPGSTKYMCHAMWHSETHVNPPCQP